MFGAIFLRIEHGVIFVVGPLENFSEQFFFHAGLSV